jgi:hypothetical protein
MSYRDKASADSDFSASFPNDSDMIVGTKAPLQQATTDNAGDMTGHEHIATRTHTNGNPTENKNVPKEPYYRGDAENEAMQQSYKTEGAVHPFHHPMSTSLSMMQHLTLTAGSPLQDQLNRNTHKAGLCVICSCTHPYYGEPIENCTAPEKMNVCFEHKLGYSTSKMEANLSTQKLFELLRELRALKIPESCSKDFRFLFYFFGHGNEREICLVDGNVQRSQIISELQKMDPVLFKLVLFDSCRSEEVNEEPIQETVPALPGTSQWENQEHYPHAKCVNTLVIHSTDYRCKAYYIDDDTHPDMKGCGLVTYYFTTLAPLLNEPLPAVLTEVRKEVDKFLKERTLCQTNSLPPQVLIYEDRLMGNVNLLAESKGTVRVRPVIIPPIIPAILFTTIQWVFRLNVDDQIRTFLMTCRGEGGESISVKEKLTMKNVAKFKNDLLEPKTEYHVKVVAVYNDGFEAESDEHSFTTLDRSSPQDVSITPAIRGSQNATVKWSFAGEDTDLSGFCVQVNDDGVTEVGASTREAAIGGLRLSAINHIDITAIYKDRRVTACQYNYQNDELDHATKISSVYLTKLSPESITVELMWEMSTREGQFPKECHFNVFANDKEMVSICRQTHTSLQLKPGTQYSLMIKTCYPNGTHLHSDVCQYTTPTEMDMKPQIECSEVERSSMTVTISDPPLFQNHSVERIHLRDSFRVRRTPIGDEENIGRYENHTIQRVGAETDTPATYRVKLAGNIPGVRYRVKVEMDCSSGDTLTNETEFTSVKPSCIQKTCCSPYFILFSCLLVALLFSGLSLSYVPYHQHLHANGGTTTHYVLTNAVVQCGEKNSQRYKGINVGGSLKTGDSLQGTFNAWLVPRDDLRLYSKQVGPYSDGYSLTGDHYALLNGWRIYPWKDSVISGYCCVQNQNKTGQTASLHVFSNDEDVSRFQHSGNARNPIISETIDVPSNTERCFQTWGKERPLRVEQSAYHYFVLTVSADNMNFTSEITILQNYINTSDYTDPKHFNYNSHTYFPFPNGIRHPTDYVTICQAPDYLSSNFSKPEAESLHILSWGSPYPWQVVFPVLCYIFAIEAVIIFIALCIAWLYLKSIHCNCYERCSLTLCNRIKYHKLN